MAKNKKDPLNKEVHETSKELLRNIAHDFHNRLMVQSRIAAEKKRDDVVLPSHVKIAEKKIKSPKPSLRNTSTVIGGALFGSFIPGFIYSLIGDSKPLIVLFVLFGFVGLLLILRGDMEEWK